MTSIQSEMFSVLLLGAKERTVSLNRSGTHKGGRKGEISYPLRSWGGDDFRLQLSSAAASHRQYLVKIRRLQASEGPVLQGPIWDPECPSQVRDGTFKAREGPFKNNVGKQRAVFIFGRGPFDQAPFHGSLHPHRQRFGCAATESGLL